MLSGTNGENSYEPKILTSRANWARPSMTHAAPQGLCVVATGGGECLGAAALRQPGAASRRACSIA